MLGLRDYAAWQARLNRVVYEMERFGVAIDREVCADIERRATADSTATKLTLDSLAGTLCGRTETNWGYWKWLADLLHGPRPSGLGLQPSPYWKRGLVKLHKGELKTDDRALEWLGWKHPEHRELLGLIRTWRRQCRVVTYARTWLDLALPHPDGSWRLHPSYGLASDSDDRPGAKTGRFGIKNPALQQTPRDPLKDPYRLRRAFIAPPGMRLIVSDYSQLEIVVMAHLCVVLFGATALRDAVAKGAPDLHSATAKYVFGDVLGHEDMKQADVSKIKSDPALAWRREKIKEIRYGLNYRKGAWGFGSTLFDANGNALGEETAASMITALLKMHPEIADFQQWVDRYVYDHRGMWSLLGRWGPLPDGNSDDEWLRKRAQRQASNWPAQATAQEIVASAMVALHSAGVRQTLQVHDEVHVVCPEDDVDTTCRRVQELLETTVTLKAHLRAEPHPGASWEDAK